METHVTLGVVPGPEAMRILLGWDAELRKLGHPRRTALWGTPWLLQGLTLSFDRPLHVALSADARARSCGWSPPGEPGREPLVYYRVEGVERGPLVDCGELGWLGRWTEP
jgi:hypothetical protein